MFTYLWSGITPHCEPSQNAKCTSIYTVDLAKTQNKLSNYAWGQEEIFFDLAILVPIKWFLENVSNEIKSKAELDACQIDNAKMW
jgi:hypothetical protein